MFDNWVDPPGVEILRQVDRRVIVDTHKVWSAPYWGPRQPANTEGVRPMSFAPPEVREHGLVIAPMQEGRQVAWIRRAFGEWLALVFVNASSADGRSQLTMPLWLQGSAFRLPRDDGT
ncbi:hypothetical protein [Mycobacteroides abscessus]|uniref:hypothetical protein n=1 Tax=Mycobacteroides abscessus TaxID=36809 RepID=UPI00092651FB|nr:hypothetical protein [Mycobacteroides abscessus]SHV73078.1 Uncharacterised protein [Mycobacteroides abscessus subsp. abscessus]SHW31706.1 Uncharacterised protein [Mycobacteroides abscessus subsp. abscessus]SHW40573.1 Uncharacterised protein [Mycobacteroides abscessus subsp. abscessus]SHW67091.1 Uncharacterised protein [Mycobacteroides abscessus subsp. abscessus]SHX17990.1 Uncharacterised protein [Mycobacteroides abscessus subsp. abscessus]